MEGVAQNEHSSENTPEFQVQLWNKAHKHTQKNPNTHTQTEKKKEKKKGKDSN